MTTIPSLTSSFKCVVNENTPRRPPKRSEKFINHYEPNNQKTSTSNSGKTPKSQSGFSIGKTTTSSPQMKDLISHVVSGSVENALQLFDEMPKRSSFLWNLVIRVLTNNGFFEEALDLYFQMCIEGVKADNFTFPFVVKACGRCLDRVTGRKIHSKLFKVGLDFDLHISNSLILMYAKLGCIGFAEKVFDEMPVRDLVSWNSMINGYILVSDGSRSFSCVRQMQRSKIKPDRFTIMSALRACSLMGTLQKGKEVHGLTIRRDFEESDPTVQTSLIDMYGKCGGMHYAERLFNAVSRSQVAVWNVMIGGYALNGRPDESFSCFRKMQENGFEPDNVSLINLLPSCSQVRSVLKGKTIHCYAIRNGFLPHIVLDTAIIDMYGKCREPQLAELTFNQMHQTNLVSRNTVIASFVQNGRYRDALRFFRDILNNGIKPDAMTFTTILPVYSEIAPLQEGKQIHGYIVKSGFSSDTFVLNSLCYMYAKCGDLVSAWDVFNGILSKDVASWNTIIMAYAIHGYGEVSVDLFVEMQKKGVKPNAITFVSVLSSCSISGMVEEGWEHFISMKNEHGINPDIEHYGCMIDLLGRLGDLDRAKRVITEIPLEPTSRIWGSLLAASRKHRNLEVAEFAAGKMVSLEHDNTGLYVLLSNLYAEMGKWEDVKRIKSVMKSQGLKKTAGLTMVEVKGEIFRFRNGDTSHEQSDLIYDVLDIILEKPLGDLSRFKPVDLLRKRSKSADGHSVRLAVGFGLIGTSIGNPVIVRKNTRVCDECHGVMKKISVFCGREIVVGDSKIYHHFRNGECCCRDYW